METIKINSKFELTEVLKMAERPHFTDWDSECGDTYTVTLIPITDEFKTITYEIPSEVWNTSASNGTMVGVNTVSNVCKITRANKIKLRTHPRFSTLVK